MARLRSREPRARTVANSSSDFGAEFTDQRYNRDDVGIGE